MQSLTYLFVAVTSISLAQLGVAAPTESFIEARKHIPGVWGDHTGSTSSYPDGSGTYIRSDDGYTYSNKDKCWTDVFSVEPTVEADDWVKREQEADCSSTSQCTSPPLDTEQRCITSSFTNVPGGMSTFAKEFSTPLLGKFTAQVGLSYLVWIQSGSSTCITVSSTFTCQWTDGKCHSIWTSDVSVGFKGYIRRRCHWHNSLVGSQYDTTVWSDDISITVPTNITRLGCAASCTDLTYPNPVPPATGGQLNVDLADY